MPRPEFSANRTSNGIHNPIGRWIAKRREEQERAREDAARRITNDTARNELAIIDTLTSIDFLHSRLPQSILTAKKDPEQKYCDLEIATRAIRNDIKKNPQVITADIRMLDEKLLTIALLLKQTVEQGDERAAYAAMGALIRGIGDIRKRIPINQPELFRQYVETNAKYMDTWITLIGIAQEADRLKKNVEMTQELYDADAAKYEDLKQTLLKKLNEDEDYAIAFNNVMNNDSPEQRRHWGALDNQVFNEFVDSDFANSVRLVRQTILQQNKTKHSAKIGQVEMLYTKVAQERIVVDPDQMNKYNEEIDALFEDIARSDQQIDEIIRNMEELDGRLDQLSLAPGAVRTRELVNRTMKETLGEIKHDQDLIIEEIPKRFNLSSYGIRSQQEMEETVQRIREQEELKVQQMAEEMQAQAQAEQEEVYEAEETAEVNYN